MRDSESTPRFLPTLWGTLKRALSSCPELEEPETVSESISSPQDSDSGNASLNSSNNETSQVINPEVVHLENNCKRQRLNLATSQAGLAEEKSFMEMMKNLLSCSICLEVNKYSNQCINGHLICLPCSGKLQQSSGDLNCPVCRVSLKHGLHRSLLAEQLTSELPAACRYCEVVIPVKHVKNHETRECPKRMVPCLYKLFGCDWVGKEYNREEHVDQCSISSETVGVLNKVVYQNIEKDLNLFQIPLQLWKNVMSKIRTQTVGSRIMIRQTALNKIISEETNQVMFKSPTIRVPFSCCSMHGFYLDIFILKSNENDVEKLYYILKSENRTKILLNYFIASIKFDESNNFDVQDILHNHHFESNHKESVQHEIKLVSLDCAKEIPKLSDFESVFVEVCFISERERSERGHGILNPNEEEEANGFLSTSGSDSNVVFTLFSPNNSSRSMNTSNTVIIGNDDSNTLNDAEPSHEEDIVITVTENVDNGDDLSAETREHFTSRNNHSYVAVPSVFINPTSPLFAYSSFPLENSFLNTNFQSPPRIAREAQFHELDNQPIISEQEVIRLQSGNSNRTVLSGESTVAQDSHFVREPLHMALYYPSQTIISPFIPNVVSPLLSRPSVAPRNIIVRPRHNASQIFTRQPNLVNVEDGNALPSNVQSVPSESPPDEEIIPNNGIHDYQQMTVNSSESNQNYNFSYTHVSNDDSNFQDDPENDS